MKIQQIETRKLKLNPKNPRKNDAAVDIVAKSIEKYGFKNPIITDTDLVVYCGNTRLKAQAERKPVCISCGIGDDRVDGRAYSEIVEIAREYIYKNGGFEKFAEWGLIKGGEIKWRENRQGDRTGDRRKK